MKITELLLAELDREAVGIRKTLRLNDEKVPGDIRSIGGRGQGMSDAARTASRPRSCEG
jgi:hypothetical protein